MRSPEQVCTCERQSAVVGLELLIIPNALRNAFGGITVDIEAHASWVDGYHCETNLVPTSFLTAQEISRCVVSFFC